MINRTSWKAVSENLMSHMKEEQLHQVIAHAWQRIDDFRTETDIPNSEYEESELRQTIAAVTAYLLEVSQ